MEKDFFEGRIIVKTGDLTEENVDAIVNAANSTLLGGGGVDGAIHAKGGPRILEECLQIRENVYPEGLPTGEAVITGAGNLPARFVIHAVGPIYGRNHGRDAELLEKCYLSSLKLAGENLLASIAFPSISTGVYGFPKDEAARISSKAIASALTNPGSIQVIKLVFHTLADAEIFIEECKF